MLLSDGSGYLKQFVEEESFFVHTSTFEAIGLLFGAGAKRQTNFICVLDSNDKCLFAAQISSSWNHEIQLVLRCISDEVDSLKQTVFDLEVEKESAKLEVVDFDIVDSAEDTDANAKLLELLVNKLKNP